jgi:hypothetical protein
MTRYVALVDDKSGSLRDPVMRNLQARVVGKS